MGMEHTIRLEKNGDVEQLWLAELLLTIIIRAQYRGEEITFFTPDDFSQQLGYMRRPSTYSILPHVHNPVARKVEWTQEVLLIKSGSVRMDVYTPARKYLQSCMLYTGDVVLLANGGHGFKIIDDAEIIEIKQGPYTGEADKTRFEAVQEQDVRFTMETSS